MSKTQYYSDIISNADIDKWHDNRDIVVLRGGTGTGKSTFIFRKLLSRYVDRGNSETLVILSNRKALKDQLKKRATEAKCSLFGNELSFYYLSNVYIIVVTYQTFCKHYDSFLEDIDDRLIENVTFVCDEFHYFLADSDFNDTTEDCLDKIMQANCCTYLMSATSREITRYINKYKRKIKGENIIDAKNDYSKIELYQYHENSKYSIDEAYKLICNELSSNSKSKVVYYLNNKGLLHSLASRLNERFNEPIAKVFYSGHNQALDDEGKMINRCTLTTTTLDNGVNFNDKDITAVIIDICDLTSIIQIIGRKRPHTPTKVYINEPSKKQICGYMRNMPKQLSQKPTILEYHLYWERKNYKRFYEQGITKTVYNELNESTGIQFPYLTLRTSLYYYIRNHSERGDIDKEKLRSDLQQLGYDIKPTAYWKSYSKVLTELFNKNFCDKFFTPFLKKINEK